MSKKKDGRRNPVSGKSSTPKKREFAISVEEHIDLQNRYIRLLENQGAPSPSKKKKTTTKKAKPKKATTTPKKVTKVKKATAPKGVESEILSTLQNMQGEMARRGRQLSELSRGNAQG